MRFLFSADLHAPADEGPYRRLGIFAAERGSTLVAVAGDLLDRFPKGYSHVQIDSALDWLRALAAKAPHLAVCSGNHDVDGAGQAGWRARAAANVKTGNLLVDGASAVVLPGTDDGDEGVIVTCGPFWNVLERGVTHQVWLRERAAAVWTEGRRLADRHPGRPWIVLHHEPPAGTRAAAGALESDGGAGSGAAWCARWCRQFAPDYLLCGHLHQSPFLPGGD